MKIFVDIDETICERVTDGDYSKAKPIQENIDRVNELYDQGHEITYWTARGACTRIDWMKTTFDQLEKWGCKRHFLRLDKPSYDLFIDDKVLNARDWEKKGNDACENWQAYR